MKTIALRFGEHFAPDCGTIAAHQQVLEKYGFVWYGKLGSPISKMAAEDIMSGDINKILLIRSGRAERYWATVSEITRLTPSKKYIPDYYSENADTFSCWFKLTKIELAAKDVMSRCRIRSSGAKLGEVSKHSMSPYFKIEYEE